MEVDLAWLQSVAARHCPAFHLHPRDRFMPCSGEAPTLRSLPA